MSASTIDYNKLFSADLPPASPRWAPFPKYYFVGGNNDPEQIPIEGLIDAAASVSAAGRLEAGDLQHGAGAAGLPRPAPVRR